MNKIQDLVAYINQLNTWPEKLAAKGGSSSSNQGDESGFDVKKSITGLKSKLDAISENLGNVGSNIADLNVGALRLATNVSLSREELDALVRNLIYQHQFTRLLDNQAEWLAKYVLERWKNAR